MFWAFRGDHSFRGGFGWCVWDRASQRVRRVDDRAESGRSTVPIHAERGDCYGQSGPGAASCTDAAPFAGAFWENSLTAAGASDASGGEWGTDPWTGRGAALS